MSLLMEALKKAEEAKRHAAQDKAAPAEKPELTLKPMTPEQAPASSASPLPDLAQHSAALDADLAAVSHEPPARRYANGATRAADNGPREAAARNAARNVFTAKQASASRTGLWLALGVGALVLLGTGVYFWWQLQSVPAGSLAARPLPPAAPAVLPPPAASLPTPTATPTTQPAATPSPAPVEMPALAQAHTRETPAAPPAEALFRATPRAPRPASTPARTTESPLSLSHSPSRAASPIERAYDALQAGNLNEAQRDYEQILRSDAKNTDALLGLATIAGSRGQGERAQAFYQLALESNPADATAQAGLINAHGQTNPALSESRLKTALASQPDASALHFALGNLYAGQQRWGEAQQAYFKAYSTEPDNPDFIFNLAVSLDHLHQKKLAVQYYQMALNAMGANGNVRNVSFDRAQVDSRILELRP